MWRADMTHKAGDRVRVDGVVVDRMEIKFRREDGQHYCIPVSSASVHPVPEFACGEEVECLNSDGKWCAHCYLCPNPKAKNLHYVLGSGFCPILVTLGNIRKPLKTVSVELPVDLVNEIKKYLPAEKKIDPMVMTDELSRIAKAISEQSND